MSCNTIRAVQLGGGSDGVITGASYNANGELVITRSVGLDIVVSPSTIQPTIGDIDGDSQVQIIEGGGANGGDKIETTIDSVVVSSVEVLAGGVIKHTLNGILDPKVYRPTPMTTTERDATFTPIAEVGDFVYNSTTSQYESYNGTSWEKFGGSDDTKADKPVASTQGFVATVNAAGDDVEYLEPTPPATPVDDAAALTALAATLTVAEEGKVFAFQKDTDTLYMWNGTAFAETGSSDNFATADLTGPNATRVHTFDQALQIVGDGQKTVLSDDGTGRHSLLSLNNGISSVENINTTGTNDSVARYEGRALPTSSYSRITATDPNTDITSKFETVGDELLIYTPAVDGGTAEVGQSLKLVNATTGRIEYQDDGSDRLHADESTVNPNDAGKATLDEIQAFVTAGNHKDKLVFYTGTDVATDTIYSLYDVDKSGVVTAHGDTTTYGKSKTITSSGSVNWDWTVDGRNLILADTSIAATVNVPTGLKEGQKAFVYFQSANVAGTTFTFDPAIADVDFTPIEPMLLANNEFVIFEFGTTNGVNVGALSRFPESKSAVETTIVDASASAQSINLGTSDFSAGKGSVLFFTNGGMSNPAQLTVDAGQTLWGVVDGVWDLSNYAKDTTFRVDNVSGGFIVTVDGAPKNADKLTAYIEGARVDYNPTDDNEDFENFDLNLLVAETGTGWGVDPSNNVLPSGWSIDGTGAIIAPAGTWTIDYYLDHPSVDATTGIGVQENVGNAQARILLGEFINQATQLGQEFTEGWAIEGGVRRQMGIRTTQTFVEPTQIHLGVRVATDGLANESYAIRVSIYDATPTEVVLAGMVTPTTPGNYAIRGVLDSYDFTAGINVLPISQCISSDTIDGASLPLYENDSQSWRTGNTLTVPVGYSGLYNTKIGIVHTDNEIANVGGEVQNTASMEFVGLKINGVDQWLAVDDATGLPDYFNFNGEVTLSEGDTIELISNGAATANEDLYITLEFSQKPTSTVVMPDAIVPDALQRGFTELLANTDYPATYADVLTLSLPSAGTYRVSADISYNFDVNSTNRAQLALNGILIAGTEKRLGDTDVAAGNWLGSAHTEKVITVGAASVLSLQAEGSTGGGANIIYASTDGNTSLAFEQLPDSTVVMPDALDVESVKVLLGSATGIASNSNVTISDTWGNLAATYDEVEFEFVTASGTLNIRQTERITTAGWTDSTRTVLNADTTTIVLRDMDITGSTANLFLSGTVATGDVNVYGVKAQKTVINTVDAEIVGWNTFTPSIEATTTNPTEGANVKSGKYRYVGQSQSGGKGTMDVTVSYRQTGAGVAGSGIYYFTLPSGYAVDPSMIDVFNTGGDDMTSWGVATLVTDGTSDNHVAGEIHLRAEGLMILVDDDGNAIDRQFAGSSWYSLNDANQEYKFNCTIPVVKQ